MVYRIFVEKKTGLDNEAKGLLNEAKNLLGIENLEDIRLFNRYDAENITEEQVNVSQEVITNKKDGVKNWYETYCNGYEENGMLFIEQIDTYHYIGEQFYYKIIEKK